MTLSSQTLVRQPCHCNFTTEPRRPCVSHNNCRCPTYPARPIPHHCPSHPPITSATMLHLHFRTFCALFRRTFTVGRCSSCTNEWSQAMQRPRPKSPFVKQRFFVQSPAPPPFAKWLPKFPTRPSTLLSCNATNRQTTATHHRTTTTIRTNERTIERLNERTND